VSWQPLHWAILSGYKGWGGKIAFVFEHGIAMAPGYGEIWYTKPLHWEAKDTQTNQIDHAYRRIASKEDIKSSPLDSRWFPGHGAGATSSRTRPFILLSDSFKLFRSYIVAVAPRCDVSGSQTKPESVLSLMVFAHLSTCELSAGFVLIMETRAESRIEFKSLSMLPGAGSDSLNSSEE
jgi:hypothetical protein